MSSRATIPPGRMSAHLFYFGLLLMFADIIRWAIDPDGALFPESIRMLAIVAGPTVFFAAAITAACEGQHRRIDRRYRVWLAIVLAGVLGMFARAVFVMGNDARLIVIDLLLFPAIFAGILTGCRDDAWRVVDRLVFGFFVFNTVMCALSLPTIVPLAASVQTQWQRAAVIAAPIFTPFGSYWPYVFYSELNLWPYLVLTMKERSAARKVLTVIGVGLYFVLAVLYQKRTPFLQLILFLGIVAYGKGLSFCLQPRVLIPGALVALLGTSALFAAESDANLPTKLLARFTADGQGVWEQITQEDRINYDPVLILTQFNVPELAFGRGLGGAVEDVFGFYEMDRTPSLHNGSALLVLKGGLTFLTIWMVGWAMMAIGYRRHRRRGLDCYYVPLLMVVAVSWAAGFLARNWAFAVLMMCAGRIMAVPLVPSAPRSPLPLISRATVRH